MNRRNLFVAAMAALSFIACGPELEGESWDDSVIEQELEASQPADAPSLEKARNLAESEGESWHTVWTGRKPVPAPYALRATDSRIPGETPSWGERFRIRTTYGLHLATDVNTEMSGHHHATIFVNTPEGMPFARFDVPFATDVPAGPGEQQAEQTESGYRVWVAMPVAGTLIEMRKMTGTWSASVYLDHAGTAAATTTFELY